MEDTLVDVRHKTRSTPAVCRAIGRAILKLCQTVPHGVVVFVPSYNYEQVLVVAWKSMGIWDAIRAVKPIFRDQPKTKHRPSSQSHAIESTLEQYSQAAVSGSNTSTSTGGGALLLSVVGGKLSEGINFANELCRCVVVVGLPYADKSDPLLQEKLKLCETNPQTYYQSFCLRAVNQSVGRAIRHANDYASIVLMDVRYPRDDGIARGLPNWLTRSTPAWRQQSTDLTNVVRGMNDFFDEKRRNRSKRKRTKKWRSWLYS